MEQSNATDCTNRAPTQKVRRGNPGQMRARGNSFSTGLFGSLKFVDEDVKSLDDYYMPILVDNAPSHYSKFTRMRLRDNCQRARQTSPPAIGISGMS